MLTITSGVFIRAEIPSDTDWLETWQLRNAADTASTDITGATITMEGRRTRNAPNTLWSITGVITDAAEGTFTTTVPAATNAATAALVRAGVWKMKIVFADATSRRLVNADSPFVIV